MDRVISLKLDEKINRPVVRLPINNKILVTLIDTGAMLPVFFGEFSDLKEYFPDAVMLDNVHTIISGFGGDGTHKLNDVCRIPSFEITDGIDSLIFNRLLVALEPETDKYSFSMILSATMFNKLNYHFIGGTNNRYWQVDYRRDVYYTIPQYSLDHKNILVSISIFTQKPIEDTQEPIEDIQEPIEDIQEPIEDIQELITDTQEPIIENDLKLSASKW